MYEVEERKDAADIEQRSYPWICSSKGNQEAMDLYQKMRPKSHGFGSETETKKPWIWIRK
jgi:hypothetical protein